MPEWEDEDDEQGAGVAIEGREVLENDWFALTHPVVVGQYSDH